MNNIKRRNIIKMMAAGSALGAAGLTLPSLMGRQGIAQAAEDYYSLPMQGDARILHITDVHGQLFPVYFREPNVNLGLAEAFDRPPHLVGDAFLREYGIAPPRMTDTRVSLSPRPVPCPRCGSDDTETISQFGSTACKALHRCRACREPFDHFKEL